MPGHLTLARSAGSPVPAPHRRSDGVTCRRCGLSVGWADSSLCTWWPDGCTARPGALPRPRSCWDCCSEDERLDLVDAGCWAATVRVRGWT